MLMEFKEALEYMDMKFLYNVANLPRLHISGVREVLFAGRAGERAGGRGGRRPRAGRAAVVVRRRQPVRVQRPRRAAAAHHHAARRVA